MPKEKDIEVYFYQGYGGMPKAGVRIGKKEFVLELEQVKMILATMIKENGYTIEQSKRQKYPRVIIK